MTTAESGDVTGPIRLPDSLSARGSLGSAAAVSRGSEWAVTAFYASHYRSLVGVAILLVGDVATAEEVVQDSFVAMHQNWLRLRDPDRAVAYLRRSVVNRSRSELRHRAVTVRKAPRNMPDMPSAEHGAIAQMERSAVIAALRGLPPRQRQAVVLRYYGDLTESQIAAVMGISIGGVKGNIARAMASLRATLEHEE